MSDSFDDLQKVLDGFDWEASRKAAVDAQAATVALMLPALDGEIRIVVDPYAKDGDKPLLMCSRRLFDRLKERAVVEAESRKGEADASNTRPVNNDPGSAAVDE